MTNTKSDLSTVIEYIEKKIQPHILSEIEKNNISVLLEKFDVDELFSAIDISFKAYIKINEQGELTRVSIHNFLKKIGGIAHNNALPPLEKKLQHVKNICAKRFNYWDDVKANAILKKYVKVLKSNGYTENQILNNLNKELMDDINACGNWTEWKNLLESWTDSIMNKKDETEGNSHTLIDKGFLTIIKKYEIIKEIGSGSFGITYEVKDIHLGKRFVLKEFSCELLDQKKNESFFKKFIKEIKFLFDLYHPNVVRIYDYKIDLEKQVGYYIMEFIDGDTIFEYLKKHKNEIDSIFEQVIDVFNYLESNNICHRDIRMANILVTKEGLVKLIDFGFVKDISDSSSVNSSTQLVIYPYDWPEELKDKHSKYDCCTEVYFVGQLFQDIITRLSIENFKYKKIVENMIAYSYLERIPSFKSINERMKA